MKRSELKAIIKECILEIFSEKFGADLSSNLPTKTISEKVKTNEHRAPSRQVSRPALDMIRNIIPDHSPNKDIMASMFADTAATTLLEQGQSEKRNSAIDTGVDPSLFEGSKYWAALAFDEISEKS